MEKMYKELYDIEHDGDFAYHENLLRKAGATNIEFGDINYEAEQSDVRFEVEDKDEFYKRYEQVEREEAGY